MKVHEDEGSGYGGTGLFVDHRSQKAHGEG